jgi:hypothetical protein
MGRTLYLVVLLGFLSGCVPIDIDPSRDRFGVSTARPDAGTAPATATQLAALDYAARSICTRGYQADAPSIQAAQENQQLVDKKLRCDHYDRLHFAPARVDWSNVW